ncbi:hypothetical protein [Pseudomonas sp.]|uniref:hypothetical protein n=1 Tax=Pseudomonas sp. TaxID=306 RepID=UPI002FCA083B
MKSTFVISLVLSLLAGSAFALPSNNPPPLLGEVKDSQQEVLPQDRHVAEGGAERTLEQRLQLTEDGAERLLEQRNNG